jgi:hypothetical protein
MPEVENLPDDKSEDETEPESRSPVQKEKEKEKEEEDRKDDEAPTVDAEAANVDNAAPKSKADTSDQSPPTATEPKKPKKDWVIVLGGATSVGKYAIQVRPSIPPNQTRNTKPPPQLARIAGYKVAASCSASSAEVRNPPQPPLTFS